MGHPGVMSCRRFPSTPNLGLKEFHVTGRRIVVTSADTRSVCNKPGSRVDCFITNIIAQMEQLGDMTRVTGLMAAAVIITAATHAAAGQTRRAAGTTARRTQLKAVRVRPRQCGNDRYFTKQPVR